MKQIKFGSRLSKTATAEVDSQHALNTREKKTLSVKACCTAPISAVLLTGIAESSTASRARMRLEQEVR